MKRVLLSIVVGLAGLLAIVYIADYGIARYRVAANRNPYGSVLVHSYYAVEEKNNKTEFVPKSNENQTCIHSLFSHLGYEPCWYLEGHTQQQITI